MSDGAKKPLGERLVAAQICSPDAVQQALGKQRLTGGRLGDCLVELGLVPEQAILRFLAGELNVRFVTAEKLSTAKVPAEALEQVPVRMAEAQYVLPLAVDPQGRVLSVVMADPQNAALLRELAEITQMRQVVAYLALRRTIEAGIRKFYYRDPDAFSAPGPSETDSDDAPAVNSAARAAAFSSTRKRAAPEGEEGPNATQVSGARSSMAEGDLFEVLQVMVRLLEERKPQRARHSEHLAKEAVRVAKHLGLPTRDGRFLTVAALLHDVGKPDDRHLTLAALAFAPPLRGELAKQVRVPVRLFEAVHLPVQVNAILAQLYEAFDGSGVPHGAQGEDIAQGARVLAAVDVFLDLVSHADNVAGRRLTPAEALAHLKEHSGKLYDPDVVEALLHVHGAEQVLRALRCDGRQVLVVDPHPVSREAVLEALTAINQVGSGADDCDGALQALVQGDADAAVLSHALGITRLTEVIEAARARAETAGVPLLVAGDIPEAEQQTLKSSGATALLVRPQSPGEIAEAAKAALAQRGSLGGPARPVRGSFGVLKASELLGTLAAQRMSGQLTVWRHDTEGRLYVEEGTALFAQYASQAAQPALTAMFDAADAEFTFDADAVLLDPPNLSVPLEKLASALGG